jgi:hypothetical protein
MSKHTPGPWIVHTDGHSIDVRAVDFYVGCISADPDTDEEYETNAANARLIAAAPDLLEALFDMVSDHADLNPATIEFARRAIAKATGAA